jgi:hypothetical protein
MNFVGVIQNLHHLRTSFNRVEDPYLHVCIKPNTSSNDILEMVNSKMAVILLDECRKALTSMGYSRRYSQRREGDNLLMLYLETNGSGYNGGLFIIKYKHACKLYDYLTAYAISNALSNNPDHFDLTRYAAHSNGSIGRNIVCSDDWLTTVNTPMLRGNQNGFLMNVLTVGKSWCGTFRYTENDGTWFSTSNSVTIVVSIIALFTT